MIPSVSPRWGDRVQTAVASVVAVGLAAGVTAHVIGRSDPADESAKVNRAVHTPLGSAKVPPVDPESPPAADGNPWKLVWSDEFNGTGPVNSGRWIAQTGNRNGWGVGGMAHFSPENAQMNGKGQLVISAKKGYNGEWCWYGFCEYSSARIQSAGRFTAQHGRIVARLRPPLGQGIFPAFWMQTVGTPNGKPGYGEIDIAEVVGARPTKVYAAAHAVDRQVAGGNITVDGRLDDGYRDYRIDWSPKQITWWVDGKKFLTMDDPPESLNNPMQIILSVQVGGLWQGPPAAETVFPGELSAEFFRVYTRTG